MQILETLTPAFRGRSKNCAQLQVSSRTTVVKTVSRWDVYKNLCIAKTAFGLNDRSLAVLNALLSFLPGNVISAKQSLVVFPSNRQLSLRAHGMPESTLRRHLASLVKAGLISRRNSPNGKRYAYKDRAGQVEEAFGFSLLPLLERGAEIAKSAEKIRADTMLAKRTREQITLKRRDLAAKIDSALAEHPGEHWKCAHVRFRAIVDAIPRRAAPNELCIILQELSALEIEIDKHLKLQVNLTKSGGNAAENERQHNESQTESFNKIQKINSDDLRENSKKSSTPNTHHGLHPSSCSKEFLDIILRTCPDIRDYKPTIITSWRDLADAAKLVAGFLGVSQSAYHNAVAVMGLETSSAAIAWILQRTDQIKCAGGYLRSLTDKAREGKFSMEGLVGLCLKTNAI
ncbi:replication initiation protein RepC [Brucella intermedia]|uniref:plasmid replication protein RepC n=1 Tax=Brucella TaxID=234 RepID=UPI00094684AD|nr:plasmid replication protein RepC [Brucella intermedia]